MGRRLFEADTTKSALAVIQELKEKLRDRIPSLDEVRALFPEIVYTDRLSKQRLLVKYVLSAFDADVQSAVVTDLGKMTIEHLIPQSRIGEGELTEIVVGQLGNLILVSPDMNEKLGSKSFQEKKKILKAAGYVLPKEIAKADDWTAKEIKARTNAMAIHAYRKLWKI